MADNILTYILELQDKISPKLKVINISNDKMLEKWSEVQVKMNAARKSIPDTGGTTKLSPRIGRIGRMGCKLLLATWLLLQSPTTVTVLLHSSEIKRRRSDTGPS